MFSTNPVAIFKTSSANFVLWILKTVVRLSDQQNQGLMQKAASSPEAC